MADEGPKITQSWAAFLGSVGDAAQGPTQQVYREWERWLGAQVERLAGNQQFVGQIGRALAKAGAVKPLVEHAVNAAMGSRSATDEARIVALEARVKTLEAQVAALTEEGESL